jgi:hypothetical protein
MASVEPVVISGRRIFSIRRRGDLQDTASGMRRSVCQLTSLGHNGAMSTRRNGSAVLERMLEPVSRSLNVEAAQKLVRLKADSKTQARVDKLARKCNEGELTAAERAEYERLVTAGTMIAILQAQARLVLAKNRD